MIEKLDIKNGGVEDLLNCIKKINEIIELLNAIVVDVDGIKCIDGSKKAEPADPYAEQRKWIGKLCKFWFADAEHPTFGILDFVDAGPHPEPFHINCGESEQGWYPHCEPVKPDDDIIYKGE